MRDTFCTDVMVTFSGKKESEKEKKHGFFRGKDRSVSSEPETRVPETKTAMCKRTAQVN